MASTFNKYSQFQTKEDCHDIDKVKKYLNHLYYVKESMKSDKGRKHNAKKWFRIKDQITDVKRALRRLERGKKPCYFTFGVFGKGAIEKNTYDETDIRYYQNEWGSID